MTVASLVSDVQKHLQGIHDDPSKSLDVKLLESIDRQVTEAIEEKDRDALLNQLSQLLPTLQQDPTPVTSLIQILISSSHPYDFSRALNITPPVDFVAGLSAPVPSINLAVLSLLEKAKHHIGDVGIVAGKADVVGALAGLWLCTPDTAVASKAHEVLLALLLADGGFSKEQGLAEGGLLWRRIFRDKDIYGSIFSNCSLSTSGQTGQPNKRDKSVAQARLLDILLHLDGEGSPIRSSQLPEIEEQYRIRSGGGILHFAVTQMIEFRDDVLMHMTLVDFCAQYLSSKHAQFGRPTKQLHKASQRPSTFNLHFLKENGIHDRILQYYVNPEGQDPLDMKFLYGSSSQYLSTYCSTYSQDVLKQKDFVESTIMRLDSVLGSMSGKWAQGYAPKHDLNVLASLPRATLISSTGQSPLFHIPPKSASEDTFNCLSHILHGVDDPDLENKDFENAAARALYFLYMEQNPTFWSHIVTAAETVAIKDVALAANSLIGSIITATWSPLPTSPPSSSHAFPLPIEMQLSDRCHHPLTLPQSGIEAIMSEPAVGIVLPYLMKPAQTFSNLVGGGRGDVESAAYKVAVAKHDVLGSLYDKLKEWVGNHPDAREMVATVGRRVSQGPMGGSNEIGGRVGTLEM